MTTPRTNHIIERPRLLRKIEESTARTILLVAPAGYGKTTLLQQSTRDKPAVSWYSAEPGSADLACLVSGLAASLEDVAAGLSHRVNQMLRALASPPRHLRALVDAFTTALTDCHGILVIDDYQYLRENQCAEELVRGLRANTALTFLVASRVRPSWASARTTMYGNLIEIGADDLAFTLDETREVLAEDPTTNHELILAKANGWPAVIGLAAMTNAASRAPAGAALTLYRFLAEELFQSSPESLQEQVSLIALLPRPSPALLERFVGERASALLQDAVAHGFVTHSGNQYELHPLIREYLLTQLSLREDTAVLVDMAFALGLGAEDWDHAFDLISRFARTDLLDSLVAAAFNSLTRSGRVVTLERIAAFARSRSIDFSPSIVLIDAELSFREGVFGRAAALGLHAAEGLGSGHPLASHAYWIAGQGAQLSAKYAEASAHFHRSYELAHTEEDAGDALWGLVLTSTYSEAEDTQAIMQRLEDERHASPTSLVRATTAELTFRRYTTGFAQLPDLETAIHALDSVQDPRVRTAFTNTYSYYLILAGRYMEAQHITARTHDEALKYRLSWVVPHAQWAFAASCVGLRAFKDADHWLRQVERTGDETGDGHLLFNAATLRARLLLGLQRPTDARDALRIDDHREVNPAMRAEVIATQALVEGVLGNADAARSSLKHARDMTGAVDVVALLACVDAVLAMTLPAIDAALSTAIRLGVWDPLLCTLRAKPALLGLLCTSGLPSRPQLSSLLARTNDFDLARHVGLDVGRRPRERHAILSPREHEILELLRMGLRNREIAKTLFISETTVKRHVHHVLGKLGARTRTEAITHLLPAHYPATTENSDAHGSTLFSGLKISKDDPLPTR